MAITGGVACGKSHVVRGLRQAIPAESLSVFDCDEAVAGLLAEPEVVAKIAEIDGAPAGLVDEEGHLRREVLRELSFDNSEFREKLELLLHPLVLERAVSHAEKLPKTVSLLIWEVPLLYEVEFPIPREIDLVVAASRETQLNRLAADRGIGDSLGKKIIEAQLPIEEKVSRGDMVIWNDGDRESLDAQIEHVATRLTHLQRMTEEAVASSTESAAEPETPETKIEVPESVDINEFQQLSLNALHEAAQAIGLRVAGVRSKHQLVFEILKVYGEHGTAMTAEGFLDFSGDGFGFLRWPDFSFASNADDVYVPAGLIKKFQLRTGQLLKCNVRSPKEREKFLSVDSIAEIEGKPAEDWKPPTDFEDLTALFPSERLILECLDGKSASPRVIDLVAPLGKGQRGLIVAPPRGGKTILLKNIAASIHQNNPETELIVLLLDERPEEVTDFRETVNTAVYSSTFDEASRRHIQVADMVLHRAKRLVETGKDVVVLLDSLTRLARAHNSAGQSGNGGGGGGGRKGKRSGGGGGGGPIGSGGISPKALERSRRFFGAARNVEEGGSLTILATCLIETDSRMDDVIFEEFKGTGNMEITLDRELAESRIFPAIHLLQSGTRKDELLYHPDEFKRINSLRKQLAQRPAPEAMEVLLKLVKSTSSNAELLLRGIQ